MLVNYIIVPKNIRQELYNISSTLNTLKLKGNYFDKLT